MHRRARSASLVVALWLAVPVPESLPAEPEVRAANGLVTIHAQATPLWVVLDRLSLASGLKVVYEGPRPSQVVSTTIESLPEAEALPRLLEGLGLNYALQVEPERGRAVAVIIYNSAPAGGGGSGRLGAPPPAGAGTASAVPEPPPFAADRDEDGDTTAAEPGFPPGNVFEPPAQPAAPVGLSPGPVLPQGPGAPAVNAGPGWRPVQPFGGMPAPAFPPTASGPAPPLFPPAASSPTPN